MGLTVPLTDMVLALTTTLLALVSVIFACVSAQLVLARHPRLLPGVQPGELVASFRAETIEGIELDIPALNRPALIVFADARCATCSELVPELDAFAAAQAPRLDVFVIVPGSVGLAREFARRTGLLAPTIADDGLIAASYRVNVSPTAVLLGTDGKVVRATRPGPSVVPRLLRWITDVRPA